MAKKTPKTPRIIPPEKQKVSWGEVCQNVGFRDNLYRTCREKIPDFTGMGLSHYDHHSEEEDDTFNEDFGKMLKQSAQAIPPPPPKDWKYEPEGVIEGLLYGNKGKMLVYGGLAALVYWFLVRPKLAALMTSTATTPATAMPKPTAISNGTTARAA